MSTCESANAEGAQRTRSDSTLEGHSPHRCASPAPGYAFASVIFRDDKTGWDGAAISIAVMLLLAPVALTFHMAHRGDDPAGPDPR
jgi:hypothetical protein